MPKLEYLDFVHNLPGMVVMSCRSFDFNNLSKAFPGLLIKEKQKGEYELWVDGLPDATFRNAFINYLGAQGWDAYAATDSRIFLKHEI